MSRTLNRSTKCDHDIPSDLHFKAMKYTKSNNGSITLSVKLDKDNVECCVCLSSMTGHIYRCKGIHDSSDASSTKKKHPGHNICSSCEWQMRRLKNENGHIKTMECPICKVRGAFTRNEPLERQLAKLSQPCCHHHAGCTERFFPWDESRKMHEEYLCPYSSVDCPFCHQSIPGGRANFVEHLKKSTANINAPNSIPPIPSSPSSSNDNNEANNNGNESSDSDYVPSPAVSSEDEENDEQNDDETDIEINDNEENQEIVQNEEKEEVSSCCSSSSKSKCVIPPCSMPFHQLTATPSHKQIIGRDHNEFVVNQKLGIVFCFIAPNDQCPCWKVYALSIDPRHSLSGNSKVYLQYADHERFWNCHRREAMMGSCAQYIAPPPMHTLTLHLGRLHPTNLRQKFNSYPATTNPQSTASDSAEMYDSDSAEMKEDDSSPLNDELSQSNKMEIESDNELDDELEEYEPTPYSGMSPCSQIQSEFIYGGSSNWGQQLINRLSVRFFALEQSLKVGCIIDARDFRGEWFEASILILQDRSGNEFKKSDDNERVDPLDVRRAKIHYLGYSGGYDEWIDIDTDSHRIAHRGTFTIGPNLRAIRKYSVKRGSGRRSHRHHAIEGGQRRRDAIERGGDQAEDTDEELEEGVHDQV